MAAMPQPHSFDPLTSLLIGIRRCPKCGQPMPLTRIEPTDKVGYELHMFECTMCNHSETASVKFG